MARARVTPRGIDMKLATLFSCVAVLASLAWPALSMAAGPVIDWDPAYTWEIGATPTNSPPGGEFKLVGIVSMFGPPLDFLNAADPTKEYTFYVHNLISLGTVAYPGPPGKFFYQTHYSGGTIELYEDTTPEPASFDANPPNATVPANFIDGTLLLSGSFTGFIVESNNFTAFNTGSLEGDILWSGGSLIGSLGGGGGEPCPGLFLGGTTWYPPVIPTGYIYRHDGKIDLQCPTASRPSTWGRVKTLYR